MSKKQADKLLELESDLQRAKHCLNARIRELSLKADETDGRTIRTLFDGYDAYILVTTDGRFCAFGVDHGYAVGEATVDVGHDVRWQDLHKLGLLTEDAIRDVRDLPAKIEAVEVLAGREEQLNKLLRQAKDSPEVRQQLQSIVNEVCGEDEGGGE